MCIVTQVYKCGWQIRSTYATLLFHWVREDGLKVHKMHKCVSFFMYCYACGQILRHDPREILEAVFLDVFKAQQDITLRCSWCCFMQRGAQSNLQRCLTTSALLWFCVNNTIARQLPIYLHFCLWPLLMQDAICPKMCPAAAQPECTALTFFCFILLLFVIFCSVEAGCIFDELDVL